MMLFNWVTKAPVDVMAQLIKARIGRYDVADRGFILENFPATVEGAQKLAALGVTFNRYLLFVMPRLKQDANQIFPT